ncbi:hypothetical protein L7F22_065415 [Adiantum nelumboides]|nr:hypothetical protein [Adiantum nelumboides]
MLCGLPGACILKARQRKQEAAARVTLEGRGKQRAQGADHADHPVHGFQEKSTELQHAIVARNLDYDQEDPLGDLLHHSQHSPLAKVDGPQKLAWLRSQLIGNHQEISTPFGMSQLVYADHTASGRGLFFIESFITHQVLPFYGNTHTEDSYVGRRTTRMMTQAEDYIKERLGGSNQDALLMCGWGCTGAIKRLQEVMGVAVPSILREKVLDMMHESKWEERWLVLVGPYEHHSNLLSWRQSLAEVREIPANEQGMLDMGRLEAELEAAKAAGRRRLVGSFSACSNVTGQLTDTRAVARILHRHGALACFDFAAGAPHMQLEMRSSEEDGYDVVMMSPHKLLGGPGAPGLLLMRKSLYKLGKNPPSTCGGGTVNYVNGFDEKDTLYHEKIEEREEGGTPPILGKIRCALAFWLMEAMGMNMIRQCEASYLEKAMRRLSVHPNICVLGRYPSNVVAPIFSFLITTTEQGARRTMSSVGKPLHARFVVKLLNDLFGIQARGGCACAGPYGHILLGISKELSLAIRRAIQEGYDGLKPGWTRLNVCYSMTEEEVEYIVSAVEFLASYGHRFLGLYDFDWRSGNWTFSEEKASGFTTSKGRGGGSMAGRERFRHSLQHAKALCDLLPSSWTPRPIPHNLDPSLLLFQI